MERAVQPRRGGTRLKSHYVIVWEFRVRTENEKEFVEKYGPDGTWATFFRNGQGYIRTELVRDVADPRRFLTLDYWQSQSEFKRFREQNRAEYERLDKEFEKLTETETRLGSFWLGIQS
jgi:heme-degrading monooxygenase HmoA